MFWARRLLALKNCQMCPQNSFSLFSQKTLLLKKKFTNKKIFSIQFAIKKVINIHFWCKMTLYRSHSDPVAMLQTK